jgi:hypothetical protein
MLVTSMIFHMTGCSYKYCSDVSYTNLVKKGQNKQLQLNFLNKCQIYFKKACFNIILLEITFLNEN